MDSQKRLIKKYPNRRLYDTDASAYITIDDVRQLVLDGEDVQVIDAKSREDITRGVLLQIVLDEHSAGAPLFNSELLNHLIRLSGQGAQQALGIFLEENIRLFLQLQRQTLKLYGSNPILDHKVWRDFLDLQGPVMQDMMSSYLAQSAQLYLDMQQRLREQRGRLFAESSADNRDID